MAESLARRATPTSPPSRRRATAIRSPCSGRTRRRTGWVDPRLRPRCRIGPGARPATARRSATLDAPQGRLLRGPAAQGREAARPTGCERRAPRGDWSYDDPYAFGPVLGPLDDHLLVEGTHRQLYERLGAQITTHEGVDGVHFAVWAPNASRVSVVGDFNDWDGRRYQMRKRIDSGLWEIFVPGVGEGAVYKYEIVGADGASAAAEGRPVRLRRPNCGPRPPRSSRDTDDFAWTDAAYLAARARGRRAAQADVDLRGASRLLAARRGRRLPDLRRARRRSWSPMPPTWASPISS